MATQTTRYADQMILNAVIRGVNAIPAPANWYVGLLTYANGVNAGTTPTRDNVVEFNAANLPSYNRKPLGSTTLTPVAGQTPAFIQNDAQWLWDEATEDWGQVVGVGLFDAQTGGNLWYCLFSPVANQRLVRKGDRLNVPAQEGTFQGGSTT